jgi:hypothetical protein
MVFLVASPILVGFDFFEIIKNKNCYTIFKTRMKQDLPTQCKQFFFHFVLPFQETMFPNSHNHTWGNMVPICFP